MKCVGGEFAGKGKGWHLAAKARARATRKRPSAFFPFGRTDLQRAKQQGMTAARCTQLHPSRPLNRRAQPRGEEHK